MGSWGPGPFDNDQAAEFAATLDNTPPDRREMVVRAALSFPVEFTAMVTEDAAKTAVAAAALVAAQCPAGQPVAALCAPSQPLPRFTGDLAALAQRALDAVLTHHADTAAHYGETELGRQWRARVAQLQDVLPC